MEQQHPERKCHQCGTPLTDETTGGLCPRCLLEMNFASRTMPGGEPSPQVPPPSSEEMAARFPQFEILECLGRGGMGIVYKARQKTLDRLVAIKVLAGERHDDPQFEARFLREARILAKLNHPNIVTVHEFGESDGMFYLVMEYVDGVNLRDVLRDGRMEPAQALAIVPEICAALQFAHDRKVVHRDIKPENILLDREGRVKIADFGIASLVGTASDHSGTPPYMAPEQEQPKGTIDHRADIYALGVVFYEMLTGERPDKDLVAPSRKVEIDVRIDELVLRALEKEPERRYQTAGEFRTIVQTMAATTPTGVHAADRTPEKELPQPAAIQSKRSHWPPVVAFRDGQRVIHWPGLLLDFVAWCGIHAVATSLTAALLTPFGGYPYKIWILAPVWWLVGALWLARAVKRDLRVPLDRLPGQAKRSDGEIQPTATTVAPIKSSAGITLAPQPALPSTSPPARKSGMVRILELLFDLTFLSPLAIRLVNLSALGFLGFLGRLGHMPHPGMRWCSGFSVFFGFFGLIGLAFIVEFAARRGARNATCGVSTEQEPQLDKMPVSEVKAMVDLENPPPKSPPSLRLLLMLAYVGLLALLILSAPMLPARVASHFGPGGHPNGWMERDFYLCFVGTMPVVFALLFLGTSHLVRTLPARFVSIPRRDEWLVPERRAEAASVVRQWLAGLLVLLTLFFAGLHWLTVAANLASPPQLSMDGLLLLTIAFLVALLFWMAAFMARMAEGPSAARHVARAASGQI